MGRAQDRPDSSFDKRPVPQIVEVPPPEDHTSQRPSTAPSPVPAGQAPVRHPERSSSRDNNVSPAQRPGMSAKPSSSMGDPQEQELYLHPVP